MGTKRTKTLDRSNRQQNMMKIETIAETIKKLTDVNNKELQKLEEEAQTKLDFLLIIALAGSLITIGFVIGISV